MKNKLIILGSILVAGVMLAGCAHQDADQKASMTNESSQSSVANTNQKKPKLMYKAPKSATKSHSYVKSGDLEKSGQYTFDKAGTRLKLDKITHPNTTVTSGNLTYQITTVKVIKNHAETKTALDMARQAMNTQDIGSTYYTLQLKFTVKNAGNRNVKLDGIDTIKTNTGDVLSGSSQLNDASAGQTVKAGSNKSTFAMGLLHTKPLSVHQITMAFHGGFNNNGKEIVKPTSSFTVNF